MWSLREGRGLAGYRKEEKEMQLRSGIFLLGHLPSVFKHYVAIFSWFFFPANYLYFSFCMLTPPSLGKRTVNII